VTAAAQDDVTAEEAVARAVEEVTSGRHTAVATDPLGHAVTRIEAGFDALLGAVGALCLIGIVGDVGAGVVSRYVFNSSFTWTEELGLWLFGYLIFLVLPIAFRRSRHLSLGFIRDAIPARWHPAIDLIVDAMIVYTTLRLLSAGWTIVKLTSGTSITLEVPSWLQYGPVPVAGVMLLAYQLFDAMRGRSERLPRLAAMAAGLVAFVLIDVAGVLDFHSESPTLVLAVVFVVALGLGVPVAYCLLFAAFAASDAGQLLPPAAVVQNVVVGASKFVLLAIPLFIVAAQIMNAGGLTRRLMNLARAAVGRFRGGLGQVNVATSVLFGFDSGSSSADASLLAKMMVPEMVRSGYPAAFCCAIIASAAILPNIIPPSIAMLLFASIADVSIGKLFVAGIIPGLMIAALLMITVYVYAWRRGYGRANVEGGLGLGQAFLRAVPALLLSVGIIGGIRFGIVTATEAGVVAVVYALALGLLFYRDLTLKSIWRSLVECAIDSAVVGFLVGVAAPFAWILIAGRVPQEFVAFMLDHVSSPWMILLALNVIMLIAGAFLDLTAIMLIVVPIAMPLILQLGVDPVHFGIMVVVNLMLGGLTPPYGLLVFIPSVVTGTSVRATFRAVMPFFLVLLIGLALITYVPAITLALVHLTF
jgi:tripartite ATP-independent transporter DctM subunit